MTTPVFTLPTSGSDPRKATKEGLEGNINQIIRYLDNARILGDDRGTEGFYNAGAWDASTGFFPEARGLGGSVKNGDTFFVQDGGAGVVDGQPQFEVGQRIIALIDNPSSTTYTGNWVRSNTIAILDPVYKDLDERVLNYGPRNTLSAAKLAAQPVGTVAIIGGVTFRSEPTAVGQASVTNDLGQDGILHHGEFNLRHVGAVCDGIVDDTAAWLRAKTYILELNSSPDWSNQAVLADWTGDKHYIPNGVDIFGLGRTWIKGEIITDVGVSGEIVFGLDSRNAEPSFYQFADLRNGKFVAQGIMNGLTVINNAPELILRADTNTTNRKSISYSDFFLGNVSIVTLIGIDGPETGVPYINSNNLYGRRTTVVNIQGDYPHNQNMFHNFCLENSTFNFSGGCYSNHFTNCRLEGTCVYNASVGTFDNWVFRSYNQFANSYFRQLGSTLTTVNNLGGDQGIIDVGDTFYDITEVYSMVPESPTYDARIFERAATSLTCRDSYEVFFDSGLIEVANPFALMIRTDQVMWQPFLYAYDTNGNLITTKPDITGDVPSLSWDAPNSRFKFGASIGDRTVIPVYPDLGAGVRYVRYTVGTGGAEALNTSFKHFQINRIERTSQNTRIPITTPHLKGFTFSGASSTTAVPTQGSWVAGDRVFNTNVLEWGAPGSKYIVRSWYRKTTGSGHVNGTDWLQERFLTGN